MIPNIERREVKAEGSGPINQRLHDRLCSSIRAMQSQTLRNRFEIVNELLRRVVRHAVRFGRGQAGIVDTRCPRIEQGVIRLERRLQPGSHVANLVPVTLGCVAALKTLLDPRHTPRIALQ